MSMPLRANAVPMAPRPNALSLPYRQQIDWVICREVPFADAPRKRATEVVICRMADRYVIAGQGSIAAESAGPSTVLRGANVPVRRYMVTGDKRDNGASRMPGWAAADIGLVLHRSEDSPCGAGLKSDDRTRHSDSRVCFLTGASDAGFSGFAHGIRGSHRDREFRSFRGPSFRRVVAETGQSSVEPVRIAESNGSRPIAAREDGHRGRPGRRVVHYGGSPAR